MHARAREIARSLTSGVLLLSLLVVLPATLVRVVGWPLPTSIPTGEQLERVLTTGELETWTVIKSVAVLVWIAWGQLALSAVAEAVAIAKGRRPVHVPSARPLRLAAANLVTSAALLLAPVGRPAEARTAELPALEVALTAAPPGATGSADPDLNGHSPTVLLPRAPDPNADPTTNTGDDAATEPRPEPIWQVRSRDTLWGIAEQTLGDGLRWREIHDLNVGRQQPDGRSLSADGDLIHPGWTLRLPSDAVRLPVDAAESSVPTTASTESSGGSVTVAPGDTLWSLAEAHLDDPHRWPELYDANVEVMQDDGDALTDPDLIQPGWELELPTEPATPTAPQTEPDEPAGEEDEDPAEPAPSDQSQDIPWSQLERPDDTGPPSGPSATGEGRLPGTDTRRGEATGPAEDRQPSEASQDADRAEPTADERWELQTVALAAAGLLVAGAIATLDRIRRNRQRHRSPGQRIRPPEPQLINSEQRIRGLGDPETAGLLDVALRSLAAGCAEGARPVPDIALVSVSPQDVAVHLATNDTAPPERWRPEDDGRTWVLTRPIDLEELRETAATALSPAPLLVTIGTHAAVRRRVMLNLGHAGLLSIIGDTEAVRTYLLAQTIELATTARADALQIHLVGANERLAPLERVRVTTEAEASEFIQQVVERDRRGDGTGEANVVIYLDHASTEAQGAFTVLAASPNQMVAAMAPDLPKATWQLALGPDTISVEPHGIELTRLELDEHDLDAIEDLLVDARTPADSIDRTGLESVVTNLPQPSANGHGVSVHPDDHPHPETTGVQVRVLGPVEIEGAGDFGSAKSEELVVYLALQRGAVDSDALHEALWSRQRPNDGRLHTTVWRARQALGDDPDGNPYLPNSKHGRYRISERLDVDLDRFNAHLRRAQVDPDTACDELHAALELVRGRPLSSTSTEYTWATHDVHALEQQISDVAHDLAELHLQHGDPKQARWAAQQGLLADPYCEILHRDLMRAASETGNSAEVHNIMRRLKHLLATDADANDADDYVDPATTTLYHELTRVSSTNVAPHDDQPSAAASYTQPVTPDPPSGDAPSSDYGSREAEAQMPSSDR